VPAFRIVEALNVREAPLGRSIPRQAQPARPHQDKQQYARDRGPRRDQDNRRNGGNAELEEGVRPVPQRREQPQQRKLDGDAPALDIYRDGTLHRLEI
jgi:hypothetical protein